MAVNETDLRPLVLERKSTPQLIPAVIMLIPGPEKLLSSRLVTQLKVTVGCRPCLKRLRIISSRTFLSVTVLGKDRLVNLQQDAPRGGPDRYFRDTAYFTRSADGQRNSYSMPRLPRLT